MKYMSIYVEGGTLILSLTPCCYIENIEHPLPREIGDNKWPVLIMHVYKTNNFNKQREVIVYLIGH